ncbi:biotin transporter BioY [Kibdelosporangium persicum]|uniref:Biotin transporter n=1 Tax=Kibdelosporangium persicum TaxID=2698649 RepID=A0ABX2F3W7_9PSEU|nr:biotin transporter BioY [Kibdelosporangium persicum]NRN66034.1 Biotin transport system substrate-specific component [Kibdelosporangium persicum]
MSVVPVPARPAVLADLVPRTFVRDAALVVGGAALTGLAAQVVLPVPGSPVPITGQTFGALLVGAGLGWRRGAASMLLYLVAGMAGVPWFQDGKSGWLGVTGGYLVGFAVAAVLVGALAARGGDRTVLRTIATMVLGNVVIYAIGVSWLAAATGMDLGTAIERGLLPFLVGDGIKILLAAGLLPGAWALANRRS